MPSFLRNHKPADVCRLLGYAARDGVTARSVVAAEVGGGDLEEQNSNEEGSAVNPVEATSTPWAKWPLASSMISASKSHMQSRYCDSLKSPEWTEDDIDCVRL